MPAKNHPPAFLFDPVDFANDGVVEAMTTEEVGAYILLMCKAWQEPIPATIPDDDRILAKWARMTPKAWKQARPAVLRAWTHTEDGRWIQKRLRSSYEKAVEAMRKRSQASATAAAARWESNASRMPDESQSQCDGNANAMRENANQIRELNTNTNTNHSSNGSRVIPPVQTAALGGVGWDRNSLSREDLQDIGKLLGWCRENRNTLGFTVEEIDSWDTQERIAGAAVRAFGIKRGDCPAVFVGIVQKRLWKNLSDEQLATGKRLLGEHYRAMSPAIPTIGKAVD